MSAKLQASNELRRFTNMFRGLIAAADELEKVGTLEQAADEARFRFDELAKTEKVAKDNLAGIEQRAADLERQIASNTDKLTDLQHEIQAAEARLAHIKAQIAKIFDRV